MLLFRGKMFGTVILTDNNRYINRMWRICGVNFEIADLRICVFRRKASGDFDLLSDDAR